MIPIYGTGFPGLSNLHMPIRIGGEILATPPQTLIRLLENPAVGNLFLLLASIIGVAGSYGLYKKRRRDSRSTLKRAIAHELSQLDHLDDTAQNLQNLSNGPPSSELSSSSVPPAETFPTTIYEANASELGILSDSELEDIVNFYTSLIQYKGIIQGIRDVNRNVPMPDHEIIVEELPELAEDRETLIQKLGHDLSQDN